MIELKDKYTTVAMVGAGLDSSGNSSIIDLASEALVTTATVGVDSSAIDISSLKSALVGATLEAAWKVISRGISEQLGVIQLRQHGWPDWRANSMKEVFDPFLKMLNPDLTNSINLAISNDLELLKRATIIATNATHWDISPLGSGQRPILSWDISKATPSERANLDREVEVLERGHPTLFLAAKVCALADDAWESKLRF